MLNGSSNSRKSRSAVRDVAVDYDGLILYANIERITPAQEAGLLAFVEGGKGFIPLHCASFCFQNSDKFIKLVGAQFARHGGEVFSTVIAEPEHAVMQGFGGFENWDETYVHRRHNDDRVVLERREQGMQARGETSEPWTWIRTHGKGRVFYTAWGHNLRTWNSARRSSEVLGRPGRRTIARGGPDRAQRTNVS